MYLDNNGRQRLRGEHSTATDIDFVSTLAFDTQHHCDTLQLDSISWMDLDMHMDVGGSTTSFTHGNDHIQISGTHYTPRENPLLSQNDFAANNNSIEISESTFLTPLTPEDRKELCIQRLSDLSANLMKNLNRLKTCTLATSFLFTPSDDGTADFLFKTIDGSSAQDNAIGKVLYSTEEFVRILQDSREALLDASPTTHSPCGKEEERGIFDHHGANISREEISEEETIRRWELLHLYSNTSRHQRISSIPTPPTQHTLQTRLSVPSTLILLTCYTCILNSFEHIFSALKYWLSIPYTSILRQHLALKVAGTEINGFGLGGYAHRNLQFKILVQVCQHMLDHLERAVWLENDGESGIFTDPVFKTLLRVLLMENDLNEEDDTGMGKIRKLLEGVLEMVK
jgi:hypothetical protein